MSWEIAGQIGPHSRSGFDASGWLWEIQRGTTARRVLVEVAGTALATYDQGEQPLADEIAEAIRTKGRSEVEKVLQLADPPQIVHCASNGCRYVSAEDVQGR